MTTNRQEAWRLHRRFEDTKVKNRVYIQRADEIIVNDIDWSRITADYITAVSVSAGTITYRNYQEEEST